MILTHRKALAVPNFMRHAAISLACAGLLFAVARAPAHAQGAPLTMQAAAQQAVLNNPEVLSRWHAVKAAEAERDAARGGYFPRADVSAYGGPERRTGVANQYSRTYGTVSLTQLLYDGFATASDVRRLDHATRGRLFELISTSEGVALDAAKAYLDVLRYRELVRLAEDNFVEHRAVFSQTDQRVKAKISRAVDLEQITGRLALAEANLLIETSNLHDTTARFQRIVGRLPSVEMPLPAFIKGDLPGNVTAALELSQANPAVLASIESVRSAIALQEGRRSAYQPRLDFRVRKDYGRNLEGIPGASNVSSAEVVLNWNLFNGLSDRARDRQIGEQLNVAKDLRDKTCRDIRQTAVIAYNDVLKLTEQIDYLALHETALTKALSAYRQQFQIGQRTLLDLLDTENELFQARRAVVNARLDLHVAYVRAHAGIGSLLKALELSRIASDTDGDIKSWAAGNDAAQQCPVEAVPVYTVDKNTLVQRALQIAMRVPAPQVDQRAMVDGQGGALNPAEKAVSTALEGWRAALTQADSAAYLKFYAPAFVPPAGNRANWEQRRKEEIAKAGRMSVDIIDLAVTQLDSQRVRTMFTQIMRSANYREAVRKSIEWQRVGDSWLIVRETVEPAPVAR